MATYANPLNLDYRFQVRGWADECLREAADPSVVVYRDRYWLFASKSGGYWCSDDLQTWTFVPTRVLPTEDYAPDVRVIDDAIWFTASRRGEDCPIWRSTKPEEDLWELVGEVSAHWDPNLFQDDDGRVYLFGGCSNSQPIWGVELDPATAQPTEDRKALIEGCPELRGWERFAEDNDGHEAPWIEGAWMTKHAGTYYLQYAAPGTQLNVYGDGVCTSDAPLGPYTYAAHNPFSFKPGGFITGAGHGSTFQDRYGNWWHIATMRISVHHKFERRLGLFPAGFDKDGVMFCNTVFADYPTRLPRGAWDPWNDPFAGWMLLSHGRPATASSEKPGFPPANAVDEDIRTAWVAEREAEPWLQIDLREPSTVHAVQINFSEHGCDQYEREGELLRHNYVLEWSSDGDTWQMLVDRSTGGEDTPHDYVELEEPVRGRFVRLSILHMPGKGATAVSGLRIFGRGNGNAPASVSGMRATRDPGDPRRARIEWEPVDGADGYIVYWGNSAAKLYSCWHVLNACRLSLNALNADAEVWTAVEAFGTNGRSVKTEPSPLC